MDKLIEQLQNIDYAQYAVLFVFGLMSMTLHECSHGYTAWRLGDPTAKDAGRLTLNPIKHIDIMGLLCIIFFHFGWAKPVPVNSSYFQNRKSGIRLVSIAGPAANMVLCALFTIAAKAAYMAGAYQVTQYLLIGCSINLGFAIFNLFPFPPLDGSKILASFFPDKLEYLFYKYQNVFVVIFIILIFTDIITDVVLVPVNFMLDRIIAFIIA
jgi:Zn-dependent protease